MAGVCKVCFFPTQKRPLQLDGVSPHTFQSSALPKRVDPSPGLLRQPTVDDVQRPIAALRKVVVVGHDDGRLIALPRQAEEQVHDRVARLGIEIAQRRRKSQGRCTASCSTTNSKRRAPQFLALGKVPSFTSSLASAHHRCTMNVPNRKPRRASLTSRRRLLLSFVSSALLLHNQAPEGIAFFNTYE